MQSEDKNLGVWDFLIKIPAFKEIHPHPEYRRFDHESIGEFSQLELRF
jgi:hypothetical protein